MILVNLSPFIPTANCQQHTATDWEVYADQGLNTLIDFSYDNTVELTSKFFDIPTTLYEYVWVRVRYKSDTCISNWSAPLKMANYLGRGDIIATPTLSVTIDPNDTSIGVELNSSPFEVLFSALNGLVHQSTDWIVKDVNNNIVWSSINNTIDLTNIQIPIGVLKNYTSYAFLVQYKSSTNNTPDIRSNFGGKVARYVKV